MAPQRPAFAKKMIDARATRPRLTHESREEPLAEMGDEGDLRIFGGGGEKPVVVPWKLALLLADWISVEWKK